MTDTQPTDVEEYARENKEMLVNVLRHGSDEMARAWAWAILDEGLSDPEFDTLEAEFDAVKQRRANA